MVLEVYNPVVFKVRGCQLIADDPVPLAVNLLYKLQAGELEIHIHCLMENIPSMVAFSEKQYTVHLMVSESNELYKNKELNGS